MTHLPYRVWWVPQIPMRAFYYEVDDLKTAVVLTKMLAAYDLFQLENNIKPDYANVGGVQCWDETECEWVDVDKDEYEGSDE